MLAAWTGNADLALDDNEADKLARAIGNVSRHYELPSVASKTKDWIMLIQSAGAIYGPRFMSIMAERSARKAAARPTPQHRAAPSNVTPAGSPASPAAINGHALAASPGVAERSEPAVNPAAQPPGRMRPDLAEIAAKTTMKGD